MNFNDNKHNDEGMTMTTVSTTRQNRIQQCRHIDDGACGDRRQFRPDRSAQARRVGEGGVDVRSRPAGVGPTTWGETHKGLRVRQAEGMKVMVDQVVVESAGREVKGEEDQVVLGCVRQAGRV